jgi:hypothetical protein
MAATNTPADAKAIETVCMSTMPNTYQLPINVVCFGSRALQKESDYQDRKAYNQEKILAWHSSSNNQRPYHR